MAVELCNEVPVTIWLDTREAADHTDPLIAAGDAYSVTKAEGEREGNRRADGQRAEGRADAAEVTTTASSLPAPERGPAMPNGMPIGQASGSPAARCEAATKVYGRDGTYALGVVRAPRSIGSMRSSGLIRNSFASSGGWRAMFHWVWMTALGSEVLPGVTAGTMNRFQVLRMPAASATPDMHRM